MASGIPKFTPHLIKSVEGATLEQLLVYGETLSFSRLHLLKSFLPSQQQGYRQQLPWIFCPRHLSQCRCRDWKQCQEVFLATKCHLNLLLHSLWYQCPPVSQYVFEHPGDGCVTFYKTWSEHNGALAARLRGPWYSTNNLPSMCLSLLDQAERRRQSGRGKQAQSCQPACVQPKTPEGPPALWRRVFLFTDAHVWETEVATMQRCQQGLRSVLHTNTQFNWH